MVYIAIGSGKYENIIIGDIFLLISQFQEVFVHFVQFFLIHFYTQYMQTVFQRCTTAAGCQYNCIIVDTNIFRIDNFIRLYILQYTILMNT